LIVLGLLAASTAATYIFLQNSRVQTFLTRRIAKEISKKIDAKITIGKVDIAFFKKLLLKDVVIEDQQADTLFFVETISAKIDSLRFRRRKIAINRLTFNNSSFNIKKFPDDKYNFIFIRDSLLSEREKPEEWQIFCNDFFFTESKIIYNDTSKKINKTVTLGDFNFEITDFKYIKNYITFKINRLILNDKNGFEIKQLNSVFTAEENQITLTDFTLKTGRSDISNCKIQFVLPHDSISRQKSTQLDLTFLHSKISFYDIAMLFPGLKGMNQVVDFSGRIFGDMNDLKGKDLTINTGDNTSAVLDFYANGISNPDNMYLFIDLKSSCTTFSDLSRIRLPYKEGSNYLNFPESFYEAGLLTYNGNFTGFLTDFVAYGTLASEMGILTTDVSVVPDEEERIIYRGKIATENFLLGRLFNNKSLGKITFDGSVDGFFNKMTQSLAGAFEGDIRQVEINRYNYENIYLDGILNNRMFDGLVIVNDSNLEFDFLGKINLNPEVPDFDFRMDVKKAMPGKLNLSDLFPEAELSFSMNANFSGNKLDNMAGSILVENGSYKNRNGKLDLKGFELKSIISGTNKYLTLTSDFFDVEINGNYYFQNIVNAFRKSFNPYLPAVTYDELPKENIFGYQIDVKNLDEVVEVFAPGYKIETPFLLYGMLDSEKSVFELKGSIPGLRSKNIMIKNIFIGNGPEGGEYSSRFKFGEMLLKNGMNLQNITIDSQIDNNEINNQITWGNTGKITYSGIVKTRATFMERKGQSYPHIAIRGYPADIYIADSLWRINPFEACIDSSSVEINNFRFYSSDQSFSLNGKIGTDLSDILTAELENIKLGYLSSYLQRELPLEGILTGTAGIVDFYGTRRILSDLTIKNFSFKDQNIGDLSFVHQWNNSESVLNSELKVKTNNRESLYAKGYYKPGTKELLYNADFDHFSLVILETLIRKNFSNFHGDATGKMRIHGNQDKILLDGTLEGSNAGLTVDYIQVSYNFNDSVRFRGDTIHFDNIVFHDVAGNRGTFGGTIIHDNFRNMDYDLSIVSDKITAINTTSANNEQFYGKVIAGGRLFITGHARDVTLTGSATTRQGTSVNINLENESELERYDFIQFVSTEDPERQEFLFPEDKDEGNFNLNLTIRATPEAKAQLIYNSQIGDVIKAQGEGVLVFGMDNDGNITLSGNYAVEKGDYLFTLQNVINKRFSIEQGGTIEWSGDPYNAIIDISAIYKLKASLYDLLVNTYDNIYQSQRIPVECKILLSEELSNPVIDFEINFPSVEDRLVDELRQFFNTQEEMNKQILSLIVLGKFYTPEYLRGTYEAQNPNLIGTTASELFSNQLSNWLSQISNNVDIGLNYRPGNQITNDEIELALSTQLFNDRVTINGNIGNNTNPNTENNSQLVGDFEVNLKLIPSGKFKFKAYNRSNNNLIYETAPYTQGIGFSVSEEYSNFKDLLNRITGIFNRKED
jgi:hypothetical protein